MSFKFTRFQLEGKPPWAIVLRGAAIPGIIVAVFAFGGLLVALMDGGDIWKTVKFGIGVGLFFSLFGVLEVVFGILFSSKDIKISSLLVLGYLAVWGLSVYAIFRGA